MFFIIRETVFPIIGSVFNSVKQAIEPYLTKGLVAVKDFFTGKKTKETNSWFNPKVVSDMDHVNKHCKTLPTRAVHIATIVDRHGIDVPFESDLFKAVNSNVANSLLKY